MKKKKMPQSMFLKYALEYSNKLVPDSEIMKNDLTDSFYLVIQSMLDNSELVNIAIIGYGASGKSTVECDIIWKGNKMLGNTMSVSYIDSDQSDFQRTISNPEIKNQFRGIDEWNEMTQTGYGATTENALFSYFTEVQTQRWIHRVGCSPQRVIDKNAIIILEVYARDTKKKVTRCKLYYNIYKNAIMHTQLIGTVDFDVTAVLEQSWYKEYMKKKRHKWNLLLKDGVRDIRDIEDSEIILSVYSRMLNLAKHTNITRDMVGVFMDMQKSIMKKQTSIISDENIKGKILSLLKTKREIYILEYKIADINKKLSKEINEAIRSFLDIKLKDLEASKETLQKSIEAVIAYYNKVKDLRKEYYDKQ